MQGHWDVAGLKRSALNNPEACSSPLLFNSGVSNMKNFSQSFKTFLADEEGATAIEYGLLASLVALAIVVGAGALGVKLNDLFQGVADKLAVPK
jgi:pilus assembly protein Flp/PilA